ncbi:MULTISPECIES: endonuclease NucS domain-containing protein [unclassified Microcoleus]|uniref:endonuclease NucS domain-containing protein n=1 Tax=unclassified Microcoleus TaxID=2642155 RepID=UPI002FD44A07
MLSSAALRKTGSGWEFANEEALEDFVEVHLQSLLGLTVIKRQFTVNEQRCDIIAVDENKRLVVLELKNGEDRYVVQQLTRYYDALLEHKPFGDRVDYAQPVRLIAITPKFHRDNFTDRKYHGLFFQFLQFAIVPDGEKLYLHLKDVDSGHISQVEIAYQQTASTNNIPNPSTQLRNLIKKFINEEQQTVLKIREKILGFDSRIQEMTNSGIVSYGKGKNKLCAEFCCIDDRRNQYQKPALFLWLPLDPWNNNCQKLGRMMIYNRVINSYYSLSIIDKYSYVVYRRKGSRYDSYHQSWQLEEYVNLITQQKQPDPLQTLVEIALEKWQKRL